MVAIFGCRLLGATDAVPSVFYVATRFFHIDFLPLFPLESYIVLKQGGAKKIPLSCKSIAVAWLRAIGWAGVLASFIWLTIAYDDKNRFSFPALGCFLAAVLIASLFTWHGCTNNATYERASELSSKLGPRLGPLVQRRVDAHFQKVSFEFVPSGDEKEDAISVEIPGATTMFAASDTSNNQYKTEKDGWGGELPSTV